MQVAVRFTVPLAIVLRPRKTWKKRGNLKETNDSNS